MSSDLRKTLRKEIATRLAVVDVNTGHMIGDLANISSDGFMVLSREPVPMNSVFQLSLALPKVIQGVDTAYFGAESLWSNPTDDGEHYWIGFHIIDISKQDDEVLKWFLESV
ncbi:MAG: PilZ domain-containing protein [Gammaproteobacteria bacterium]|nr:PilZ domain-containing protein [Gammaproteobacteria bacterium]